MTPHTVTGPDWPISIFPQHRAMLEQSGIPVDHALARGYVSVDTVKRLIGPNITKAGRKVPGLLVPQRAVDGSVWGYQYRPDSPRLRDGKPVKYETPFGQRNGLDVPPGVGPKLGDPKVTLWVTEGVKKADAGAVVGLTIVALPGVWSWTGTNSQGGKTAIPDWRDVALNDRMVVLAFDSDVTTKPQVRAALTALADYLRTKGANVFYCHLPNDDDGKTGLDDYLAAGHTVLDLAALVRPDPPETTAEDPPAIPPVQPVPSGTYGGVPETGTDLLDDVRTWLGRFIRTVEDAHLDLLTLWAAHTHLVTQTYSTPRLLIDSPVPSSGKSTVMEHLNHLCHQPVLASAIGSPALIVRMLDAGMRTFLIDEADRVLNPDKEGVSDLLAVLNSGYKVGATRPVLVPAKGGGWEAKEMPTYAPVAMAGNHPNLPDDTTSRTIRVLLFPDLDGTVEESNWEIQEEHARSLQGRLSAWAEQVSADVLSTRPAMPAGVIGRARERWQPLKRVAVAAGGRWADAVDQLATNDVAQQTQDREEGLMRERPALVLLDHLSKVWPDGENFVATTTLVDLLIGQHPESWGAFSPYGKALTAQRFGQMLVRTYDLHSSRVSGDGPRGYYRTHIDKLTGLLRRAGSPTPLPINRGEPAEPAEPAPLFSAAGRTSATGETP